MQETISESKHRPFKVRCIDKSIDLYSIGVGCIIYHIIYLFTFIIGYPEKYYSKYIPPESRSCFKIFVETSFLWIILYFYSTSVHCRFSFDIKVSGFGVDSFSVTFVNVWYFSSPLPYPGQNNGQRIKCSYLQLSIAMAFGYASVTFNIMGCTDVDPFANYNYGKLSSNIRPLQNTATQHYHK